MKLGSIDTRNLRRETIHDMDNAGSVFGQIAADFAGLRHTMTLSTQWENCGATFEDVVCGCGMAQHVRYGSGCWQHGHNEPMPDTLTLDAGHAALYDFAQTAV